MKVIKNCYFFRGGDYNERGIDVQSSRKSYVLPENQYSVTINGKNEIVCIYEINEFGKKVTVFYPAENGKSIQ